MQRVSYKFIIDSLNKLSASIVKDNNSFEITRKRINRLVILPRYRGIRTLPSNQYRLVISMNHQGHSKATRILKPVETIAQVLFNTTSGTRRQAESSISRGQF